MGVGGGGTRREIITGLRWLGLDVVWLCANVQYVVNDVVCQEFNQGMICKQERSGIFQVSITRANSVNKEMWMVVVGSGSLYKGIRTRILLSSQDLGDFKLLQYCYSLYEFCRGCSSTLVKFKDRSLKFLDEARY